MLFVVLASFAHFDAIVIIPRRLHILSFVSLLSFMTNERKKRKNCETEFLFRVYNPNRNKTSLLFWINFTEIGTNINYSCHHHDEQRWYFDDFEDEL